MENQTLASEILETLKDKTTTKQLVYDTTRNAFEQMKGILKELELEYNKTLKEADRRIKVIFHETGSFDLHFKIGSDILVFSMHTNTFRFDQDNVIWKHSYLKDDETLGFVGQIAIYNFLADSFTHNRFEDLGYLVARIFINKENHYMVEGKRQLSYHHHSDLSSCVVNKENLRRIIETAIHYSINFDLLIPPYEVVKLAAVAQMHDKVKDSRMQTGKRLGFNFNADDV